MAVAEPNICVGEGAFLSAPGGEQPLAGELLAGVGEVLKGRVPMYLHAWLCGQAPSSGKCYPFPPVVAVEWEWKGFTLAPKGRAPLAWETLGLGSGKP